MRTVAGKVSGTPAHDAAGKLQANMRGAGQIQLRGTPTFVWRNPDGSEGRLNGIPDDFGTLVAKMGG